MKIVTILISLYLAFSSLALASTAHSLLVIVNVEDTLKVTHSQSFWDSLNYVHDSESQFLGMNRVLNLLMSHNASASFAYLTEPQELLAGPVQLEFLKKNDFPRGHILSYKKNTDVSNRLELLRNVIQSHNPTKVVLIGHNGGIDVEVYQAISQEFPAILFRQYIHVLYSPNAQAEVGKFLNPFQRGYVTAIELLMDLYLNDLVDGIRALEIAADLQARVLTEEVRPKLKEVAIPSFARCDSFNWTWDLSGEMSFLSPLKDHLSTRCYMQFSYEN